MDTEKRREQIILHLKGKTQPIRASSLAETFGVSRQIIVGDVALLRALGYPLISTSRGYLLEGEQSEENGYYEVIYCCHGRELAEKELRTIVDFGGEVMNTIVEHPIYGAITVDLKLKCRYEVDEFIQKQNGAGLISEITGGLHAHTIRCQSKEAIQKIRTILNKLGILREE